jgi:dimethylhistidine N-methyltransferase
MNTESLIAKSSFAENNFIKEVLAGLSKSQKTIDSKYLYDQRGSELFEKICKLPEYYPTRTEAYLLKENSNEIAGLIGRDVVIIEPGSGEGQKIKYLLNHFEKATYIPIEISCSALHSLILDIVNNFPKIELRPICADFHQEGILEFLENEDNRKKIIFFPGSTIGNLHPKDAINFLKKFGKIVGTDGGLLIGVDLKKDKSYFLDAYNDEKGITAEFNMNVLERLNRDVGTDFCIDHFEHKAIYNQNLGRVEMHLMSKINHTVTLNQRIFHIQMGESIHTESSYKYTREEFIHLSDQASWKIAQTWSDPENLFCLYYFTKQ